MRPYSEIEAAALADLATRTIADPASPAEHVEAAQQRLAAPQISREQMRSYARTLDVGEIDTLRRLLGPLARRR